MPHTESRTQRRTREEGPLVRSAVLARCRGTLDARDVSLLRALGWDRGTARLAERAAKVLETLIQRSLIRADGERLQITERGRAELGEDVWEAEEQAFYARATAAG